MATTSTNIAMHDAIPQALQAIRDYFFIKGVHTAYHYNGAFNDFLFPSISCLRIASVPLHFSLTITLLLYIHSLTFYLFIYLFLCCRIHFLLPYFHNTLILLYCFVSAIGAEKQCFASTFLCIFSVNIKDNV